MLSIQLVDSIIAGSIQICLLCLQPEPLSRSLAARISQFTLWTLAGCLLDMGAQLQHASQAVLLSNMIHLAPITAAASEMFHLRKSSERHSLCFAQ